MKRTPSIRILLFIPALLFMLGCEAQNGPTAVNESDNTGNIDPVTAPSGTDAPVKAEENEVYGPVFHRVKAGETIASIISQYGLSREQFGKWNFLPNGIKPGINVAVKFSWHKKEADMAIAQADAANSGGAIKYHRVEAGETLYHLSVMYHVSVNDLKAWNNLSDNTIKANKKLIVSR